jgi:hypothetical protein
MRRTIQGPALLAMTMTGTVLLGLGCENSAKPSVDTSNTEATVKGTITFKGKPVTKGEVSFDPSNYKRNVPANRVQIGPDGSYQVKTLVGENRVSFAIREMMRDPKLQDLSLIYQIKDGENTINLDLPPPDQAP